MKHWEYFIGHNWSKGRVKARTIDEALRKVRKLALNAPYHEREITKIELVSEAEV